MNVTVSVPDTVVHGTSRPSPRFYDGAHPYSSRYEYIRNSIVRFLKILSFTRRILPDRISYRGSNVAAVEIKIDSI